MKRADGACKVAKIERITLHEARHTYASVMIAAGVAVDVHRPREQLDRLDRYGHLMPGNEAEAATLLDA